MEPLPDITIDDFKKIDLRIGTIVSAVKMPEADKLLELHVDLGEGSPRQIISGIATYVPEPEQLVGKQCVFVANMVPRELRGKTSNGMLVAASTEDGQFAFLVPSIAVPPGTTLR